ncbi:thiamine pyrophosphate-dependent enzyme [Rhizosaccharibacter radicis]|uniref:Thiamine pyrophosphate-binding protein n=1 Tax=Rhizosaccharibacter radicis TaxID=2782605 RepID=A0ABT1VZH2_9PROT|nr:thiamine pyrophosphate-binding protein [Acetobacteraceae bacterium KSS12]
MIGAIMPGTADDPLPEPPKPDPPLPTLGRRGLLQAAGLAGMAALPSTAALAGAQSPPAGMTDDAGARAGPETVRAAGARGDDRTTADILVEAALAHGATHAFGIVGDGVNPVIQALWRRRDRIAFVGVRHEEAAAFMASGFFKHGGRLGLCVSTSGPGAVHLLNGLFDASLDGAAVLAITGATFHDMDGMRYPQALDAASVLRDAALFNERVSGPAHALWIAGRACRAALEGRGVAHLTIAKDVQGWRLADDHPSVAPPAEPGDGSWAGARPFAGSGGRSGSPVMPAGGVAGAAAPPARTASSALGASAGGWAGRDGPDETPGIPRDRARGGLPSVGGHADPGRAGPIGAGASASAATPEGRLPAEPRAAGRWAPGSTPLSIGTVASATARGPAHGAGSAPPPGVRGIGDADSPWISPDGVPPPGLLDRAATILNGGRRVAILAGQGCLGARAQLETLAELLGAPVAKAFLGKALLPDDHPLTTGGIGHLGSLPSRQAMMSCDTLLILGSTMPWTDYYPPAGAARCLQLDRRADRIGLRHPVELGLVGDAGLTLDALIPRLRRQADRGFLQAAQGWMRDWRRLLRQVEDTQPRERLRPQAVVSLFGAMAPADAMFSLDCGANTQFAARHIQLGAGQEWTGCGTLVSMASALPLAIGGAFAHPGRPSLAVAGDGGLAMLMAELSTAALHRLPVKLLVLNNEALGQELFEQRAMGMTPYGCALGPVDFAAAARAMGVAGLRVSRREELAPAFRQAFETPGPVVIDALVDPGERPAPPDELRA